MAARRTSAIKAVKKAVAKATRRTSASRRTPTQAPPKKAAAKKAAPAKKAAAKKAAPAKKTGAKKAAPAKKAAVTKAGAKKAAPAKKAVAKKTAPAKKAAAKKTAPAKKAAAKKTAPAKKAAAKRATPTPKTQQPARAPSARKAAAVKMETASSTGPTTAPTKKAKRVKLAVREGEKPWTTGEIREVQASLEHDAARLKAEIAATEEEIGHLLREGGEGAGNDQADVGSNTFERDHEMTMAKNARESLHIIETALGRVNDGTYGVCESCGQPIGKMRLQAFPRATLCLECKQRQERR